MEKKKIYLAVAAVAVIAVVVALVSCVCGACTDVAEAIDSGVAMLCSAPMAATAAATQQETVKTVTGVDENGNFVTPEINKPTVSKTITKVMPSLYPLDTMLRELPKGTTNSDKYEYFSVVARGTVATVKTASTASAIAKISLASAHMLSLDGNLIVPAFEGKGPQSEAVAAKDSLAKNPLVLHIVKVDYAASEIEVIALNASKVPVIPQNTPLYRAGVAKDQLAAISDDPQILPTKDFNYCQINMCTISQSKLQALQDKEAAFGMAELQEQAIMDFRYQNELNALFGYGREIIDPHTNKAKYTMTGLVHKVGHVLDKGSASSITKEVINGWMAEIFSNNNGSDTRVMLYGPDFATAMANSAAFEKQLEAGKTEVKFGLKWKSIETNHGTLLCRMHSGLGLCGYGNAAIVIDPANVRRIEQIPLTEDALDLDKSGKRRTDDVRLMESFTIEVTNPDTHAVLFA